MSIYITGDTHGRIQQIEKIEKYYRYSWTKDDYLIICGDFGFVLAGNTQDDELLDDLSFRPYTILFIDGNHENFPALFRYSEEVWHGGKIHRIRKNIYHLMRGQIFDIEGKSFFTFGGAYSIDRALRKKNESWWPEEIPTEAEYREAVRNLRAHSMSVDYIITHTMPTHLVQKYRPNVTLSQDAELSAFLDTIWRDVEFKHWYCGHWHDDSDEIDPKLSLLWFDVKKIH